MRAETNRPRRRAPKDPYDQRVWLGRTKQEERFWLALLSSLGQVSGVAVVSRPDIRATLTLTKSERLALLRTNRKLSIRRYTKKLRLRRGVASIDVRLALRDWDRLLRRLSVQIASMNRSRTRASLQRLIERIEALLAGFEQAVPPVEGAELVEKTQAGFDFPVRHEVDALWAKEAEDRIEACERGETKSRPAGEVFETLDRPPTR